MTSFLLTLTLGIKDSQGWSYVNFHQLEELSKKFGLVVVYDQSMSRGSERIDANNKTRTFSESNLHCFYLIAQACFAFISQNKDLLEEAKTCLLREQVIYPERLVELNENETQPN